MAVFSKIVGSVVAATSILAVFAAIKAYRYVNEYRNIFKDIGLQELPGRKRWLGSWDLWMNTDDMFALELELVQKHGKVFGYFEGRQPAIMMADVEMLKQVLIKDHEHFYDRRVFIASRESSINLGLTELMGPRWKHVRQQLTPVFTPANLRRMEPLVTRVVDQLVVNIGKHADNKTPADVKEYAGFFTLDAIASVAFGLDIDSFNTQDSPFVKQAKLAFTTFLINDSFLAFLLMFPGLAVALTKTPVWKMLMSPFKFFENVIAQEIERRKKEGTQQRHDLLSQLMPLEKDPKDEANKPYIEYDELGDLWLQNGLTRGEIYGQTVLFFLAGYETTASTLTMTLLALSQNPEVQEKLYEELKDKEMTVESLTEVKYLEMVINETLRYYAPLLRIDRMCTSDTVVNGLNIPKGVVVTVPVNAIHHDPDYWPDPERFDPERFSEDNASNIPACAFLPFGAGNRNCVGMRLALIELKLSLSRLIREFRFSISPELDLPIRWIPTGLRTPHCKLYLQPERRA